MATSKIIKDTLYYGLVPKLSIFVTLFTTPLITPFLMPYDYGISGVIVSYTGFIGSLAPLGLHVHLSNSFFEIPKHYNLVWGRVLFLVLFSSFVLCILNIVILFFVLPLAPSFSLLCLCIAGTLPVLLSVNTLLAQHLFPLIQDPRPLVFTGLIGSLFSIFLTFVLIYYYRLGYWGLILPGAISSIIVFVIYIKLIWINYNIRPIIDQNYKRLKEMFTIALPLIPHNLGFVLLTSSSRVVMSQLDVSYDDIGLYSHGCSMGDYAIMITTALITAISPQMQRAYRSHDYDRYRRLYILCQGVCLMTSFLICIWIPDIYNFLIRNEVLKQSSDIASYMCFSNVVFAFYTFVSMPVFVEKKTMQLLWLVFIPGFFNLVLCYIFIPVYGYKAAIYTTIFSYWTQLMIPFFIGYYNQNVRLWLGALSKIFIILFVLLMSLVVAQLCVQMNVLYRLSVSIILLTSFVYYYRKRKIYELI